jgi:molybdenum cofactor guanylyltransferase
MSVDPQITQVPGYLIAGGKSRRMGFDKRTLSINGQTLLARSAKVLEDLLGTQPQVVGDNPVSEAIPNLHWLPDAMPDQGPLGGLVSALRDAASGLSNTEIQARWVMVLAADMPAITADDLRGLLTALNETDSDPSDSNTWQAICLGENRQPEPLAAMYAVSTLSFWSDRLKNGQRSLRDGLKQLDIHIVPPSTGSAALHNLNTASDLKNGPSLDDQ